MRKMPVLQGALPSDQANAIAFDADGNIYVGTQCDGLVWIPGVPRSVNGAEPPLVTKALPSRDNATTKRPNWRWRACSPGRGCRQILDFRFAIGGRTRGKPASRGARPTGSVIEHPQSVDVEVHVRAPPDAIAGICQRAGEHLGESTGWRSFACGATA